jgi:hypothetical protein
VLFFVAFVQYIITTLRDIRNTHPHTQPTMSLHSVQNSLSLFADEVDVTLLISPTINIAANVASIATIAITLKRGGKAGTAVLVIAVVASILSVLASIGMIVTLQKIKTALTDNVTDTIYAASGVAIAASVGTIACVTLASKMSSTTLKVVGGFTIAAHVVSLAINGLLAGPSIDAKLTSSSSSTKVSGAAAPVGQDTSKCPASCDVAACNKCNGADERTRDACMQKTCVEPCFLNGFPCMSPWTSGYNMAKLRPSKQH